MKQKYYKNEMTFFTTNITSLFSIN